MKRNASEHHERHCRSRHRPTKVFEFAKVDLATLQVVMKDMTRKVKAKGRMDGNSWWVSELLGDREKACYMQGGRILWKNSMTRCTK